MIILAIDPGTRCGWALLGDDDSISSGVWDLRPRRGEHDGWRPFRLVRELNRLHADKRVERIAFEQVRRHMGVTAAHVYGELIGALKVWCVSYGVPFVGVEVSTVKKHATGKGNADKAAMMAAAAARWPAQQVTDDNQADALWILDVATEGDHHG